MSSKPKRQYNPYKRYCCVYGCLNRTNSESELAFFKIPRDIERRQEWLKAIDREDLLDVTNLKKAKENYVCSAHFDNSSIITTTTTIKRLQCDAAPSKLLPHKSHKNIQPDARDIPQISKDISSHLQKPAKKDKVLVSTYSHTQSQTENKSQQQKEIESDIAQLNPKSTVLSKPTSTSKSHTKEHEVSNKKPKMTSTSTQTDLKEISNKMTQTASALSDKYPRKRKLKNELETVKNKRQQYLS